ncbi:MAG: antibiotic biosynthesis monooxygenase [Nitrospinota bacterium]|jgi:heme-degrading monooxygenase HmoA|nr:antibiotic biosynthesis monooxygenase [Nitrospinota bacterium]MDP6366270.1 antibiotic biosynthesis monooxygenase [Nitrospinota bacterium]MDP7167336.1 antibiotic biosynthesis monooxygenase [Nitrospinota bacterium]MDP7371067.1 antibiotic biosynthesis monooxygenase [Nitrospinota bacterium]MDP7504079.1 antibiotic biosynthesis monooxygenase [Nitrospinota bacterium]
MYIVMNRFQVAEGREGEFEEIWRTRDSYLKEVDGFREFNLLRGEGGDFISHTIWESKSAFEGWVGSDAFHKAHSRASETPPDIFAGPAKVSMYDVLMTQTK